MTSDRLTVTLCLVLLIIGRGATAPADDSDSASSDEDSANQDDAVQDEPATGDDDDGDDIANADAEYELLSPHFDYDDYDSSDDDNGNSDRNEQRPLARSGHLLLSQSDYRGDDLVSTNSEFPENQQQHKISQTLNPAYLPNQRQSNYPHLHTGHGISRTWNPAYATNHNTQDYRGRANSAKLLYLLGQLSNVHASSSGGLVGYGQYGHSSQSQPALSGTLGGRLSYGHNVINAADSGSSSSGSTYDYLSSAGSSFPVNGLGGQAFIKLIRPLSRFVAIQEASPQKHWFTFLENLNQAKLSGTGAYQTLQQHVNYETQRQQRIILLLKRYREIAARRKDCPQTGK